VSVRRRRCEDAKVDNDLFMGGDIKPVPWAVNALIVFAV
jgi:hypothetical protein